MKTYSGFIYITFFTFAALTLFVFFGAMARAKVSKLNTLYQNDKSFLDFSFPNFCKNSWSVNKPAETSTQVHV